MAATQVRKLYPLLCGFEIIPQSVSLQKGSSRIWLSVPVMAYLLETAEGYVLVDTGLDPDKVQQPALRQQYYTDRGWNPPPIVQPEHSLLYQLKQTGVVPAGIVWVVLTHLHADHTGNLRHFAHARLIVQRQEYLSALQPGLPVAFFRSEYEQPAFSWQLCDGDLQLMPGLELLFTPGHTAGHQSVKVHLPQTGVVILTGDAGDLQQNFMEEIPPGEAVDAEAALHSLKRLKALAAQQGAQLFYTHDPVQVQQMRLAPDFYS